MTKCDFCKKNKIITITCVCGGNFCIKHNLATQHNCNHQSETNHDKFLKEATGNFSKIEKI